MKTKHIVFQAALAMVAYFLVIMVIDGTWDRISWHQNLIKAGVFGIVYGGVIYIYYRWIKKS